MKNKYEVGCIVTLKTHPLLYEFYVRGDGKLIPPFMIVKEVNIEPKNKKLVDEITGFEIAHRVKYTCCFFNDNKSEFEEVVLYEPMLEDYTNLYIASFDKIDKANDYKSLIKETKEYVLPEYEFGKLVSFRTKKYEIFKKRKSVKITNELKTETSNMKKETIQYIVNYATPDFIICGIKKTELVGLFYTDGQKKKLISNTLLKVKWFNSFQMKFSEIYLPIECFTDIKT